MPTMTGTAGGDVLDAPFETYVASTNANGNINLTMTVGAVSPFWSPDGTSIVFYADGAYVAADTNIFFDVYAKNLATGEILLVSSDSAGVVGNAHSGRARFSPDGNYVVFESSATNLVAGDVNGAQDIFLKNLITGETTIVSIGPGGAPGNAASSEPIFTPDGNVIFASASNNLVAGDTNGVIDLFMKNLTTGAVTRLSVDHTESQLADPSLGAAISGDGTKLVFTSGPYIFLKNLTTGTLEIISTTSAGGMPSGASNHAAISRDGTKVAFFSVADNLVAGDNNGCEDVFVKDLATGVVTRVSVTAAGTEINFSSFNPEFSPDGTKIVFESNGPLTPTDDFNNQPDIFVKDLITGAVTRISRGFPDAPSTAAYGGGFSPDGRSIVFFANGRYMNPDTNGVFDVYVSSVTAPGSTGVNYTLDGGDGDDTLYGALGHDYLRGGTGADAMYGGFGNDIYIVDDAGDTASETGGGGTDKVRSSIDWTLGAGFENLDLLSGGGSIAGTGNGLANAITGNSYGNTLNGLSGDDVLVGGGGGDALNGGDDADSLDGGGGDDTLNGDAGNDDLVGGAGNDHLNGGAGADGMAGGLGNDTYVVDNSGDAVNEAAGAGTDTVEASVDWTLGADVEHLVMTGLASSGTGNGLRNTITGNAEDNSISGEGEIDTLYGLDGADQITGGDGNDIIDSGGGRDLIVGGAGGDRLTGGAGADRFLFTPVDVRRSALGETPERDQILDLDFAAGDVIDLSYIDADPSTAGPDEAFVFVSRFTHVAGQAVLKYAAGTNITTLELDVDGDGKADFRVAITGNHAATTGNLYTGGGDTDGGWLL